MNPAAMYPSMSPMMAPPSAPAGFAPPSMQATPMPPAPPAPMAMPGLPGQSAGMDSFSAQGGMPAMSEADMALLSQILGGAGQTGMGPQMPGQAPAGPTSNLQVVPNPANGMPMVLEDPSAAMPIGAPGGFPGGGISGMPGMRPPSLLSVLTSPMGLASLGILGVAGFFGIRAILNRGKAAGGNALESLIKGKEELLNDVKNRLGNADELAALEEKTKGRVDKVMSQNLKAFVASDEKKQAGEKLIESTNGLFSHARELPEGGTLAQKVVDAFEGALSKLKQKLSGEEAAQVAE